MYSEELLKKLSEPADLAVFLLGFAAGFLAASVYLTAGPPPGTVAGVVAVAFLGVKKGADASLSRWRHARRMARLLRSVREHFKDDPSALRMIDTLNEMLSPPLLDFVERRLNEKLETYTKDLLGRADELDNDYKMLWAGLVEFHRKAENPKISKAQLHQLWEGLGTRCFDALKRPEPDFKVNPDE